MKEKNEFERQLNDLLSEASPEAREILTQANITSYKDLLKNVAETSVPLDLRLAAIETLGNGWKIWDKRKSVWSLIRILFDQNDALRIVATIALSKIGHKASVPYLIKAALTDKNYIVQLRAMDALRYLEDSRSIEPLMALATNKKVHVKVRTTACEVLGQFKVREAVSLLIDLLADQSEEVRFYAAFALGLIGDKKAVPRLKHLAVTDTALVQGMWSVSKEASDAIIMIHAST